MRYLETIVTELLNYRNSPEISPLTLLNYAYDIVHSEKIINSALLRKLNYIKDNTDEKTLTALAIIEFIFNKNKNSHSTSKIISIKNRYGVMKTYTLSDLLVIRQNAIKELIEIQAKIIKTYDLMPKLISNENKKLSGISEILDDE